MQEDNGCKILPKVVDAQKMIWKHRVPYPALSGAKPADAPVTRGSYT